LKIFFIGDIFGKAGRVILAGELEKLKKIYNWDICIANAENSAGGKGITYDVAREILNYGVDALTLGNHAWARKEILDCIDSCDCLIRPANFPVGVPGKGRLVIDKNGIRLGVLNLVGRVYMEQPAECPFLTADREISILKQQCSAILVDFHAEATSEKAALAYYLDGKVSAVVGTHTHVQTADERILNNGTAFITDVGMTGPSEGIIGVERSQIINKFVTGLPARFKPASGRGCLNAVLIKVDDSSGKATGIERIAGIYEL